MRWLLAVGDAGEPEQRRQDDDGDGHERVAICDRHGRESRYSCATRMRPFNSNDAADRNWRRFVLFRVLFNSRFYYPVLAVLFLDLGLSATEYTLLNFAWAVAIVITDVPAGVLADRFGRNPLLLASAAFTVGEMALLILAPRNGGVMLFLFCLGNRVL